jgi:hypothetical protein
MCNLNPAERVNIAKPLSAAETSITKYAQQELGKVYHIFNELTGQFDVIDNKSQVIGPLNSLLGNKFNPPTSKQNPIVSKIPPK